MAAYAVLESAWKDFPFQEPIDMAVCLAALLTLIQRPLLENSPLFAVSANSPGVGKTQLVEGLSIIANGEKPLLTNYKRDPAEDAKRLLSILRAGIPVVNLDNVALGVPLISDPLCTALTSTIYSDRILGVSTTASVPSDGVTWFATGNNLTIGGDLCRRTLEIRLLCKMEKPEERKFEKSFTKICTERRDELLQACVDILLAFESVNDKPTVTLGSFDCWADKIGSCVLWVTGEDVTGAKPEAKAEGDLEVFSQLLQILNSFEETRFIAKKAEDLINNYTIQDVLQTLNNGRPVTRWNVSKILSKFQNKIVDGLYLSKEVENHNKTALWRLNAVSINVGRTSALLRDAEVFCAGVGNET